MEQVWYYSEVFLANVRAASVLEWIAAAAAVAQVLLAWKARAGNYAFGILSTAIYIYFFAAGGLYADASLNVYYLVMSIYGWWHWQRSKAGRGDETAGGRAGVHVQFSTARDWSVAVGIAMVAFLLGYAVLTRFSNSQVPVWDAGLAALAWAGMWLLARRKVENWLWLNASNAVALPLYFFKGMMLTMVLTGFLFVVAIAGYFSWRRMAMHARDHRPGSLAHRF